jgi:hypothetical protein
VCCEPSTLIYYAVPDSNSIKKLRSQYVKRNGGMSMDAPICHVPIGVDCKHYRKYLLFCENYNSGEWIVKEKQSE